MTSPPPAPRWRHWAARALLVLLLGAGVAVAVVGLAGDGGDDGTGADTARAPTAPAGSRFAPAQRRPRRGIGLVDALAPVLASSSQAGPSVARSVEDLAARLPLRRQVAQLFVVGFKGRTVSAPIFRRLLAHDWGGVLIDRRNYTGDPQQLADLAGEVSVVARRARHVPPLVAARQVGGPESAFPNLPPAAPPRVALTSTPARAAAEARVAGAQLRLLGVNMTLAPVADVTLAASARTPISYGDDSGVVTRFTRAVVDGYRRARIVSAVGHFPGEGTASQDPSEGPATVGLSFSQLRARDLRPFVAIANRVPVIVLSNALYATFDGVTPAALTPEAVRLLREGLRFSGVVMSDDLVVATVATGGSVAQAAVSALRAGDDLLLVSGDIAEQEAALEAVTAAVRRGTLSRERIRTSLLRILEMKRRYGLIRR